MVSSGPLGEDGVDEREDSRARSVVRHEGDALYTFNNYRVLSMREVEVPVGALTTGLVKGYDIHRANLTRERRYLQRVRGGEVWSGSLAVPRRLAGAAPSFHPSWARPTTLEPP